MSRGKFSGFFEIIERRILNGQVESSWRIHPLLLPDVGYVFTGRHVLVKKRGGLGFFPPTLPPANPQRDWREAGSGMTSSSEFVGLGGDEATRDGTGDA